MRQQALTDPKTLSIVSLALLLMLQFLIGGSNSYASTLTAGYGRDLEEDESMFGSPVGHYEIELRPFQMHLQYDNNSDAEKMIDLHKMEILQATQDHLHRTFQMTHPSFLRLELLQFVRDYYVRGHYTKIAMTGKTHFFSSSVETNEVMDTIMKSFHDYLLQKFLVELDRHGIKNVTSVALMTMSGGEMSPATPQGTQDRLTSRNSNDMDREMKNDMKFLTLMVALMLPFGAVCAVCTAFAYRSIHEINWGTFLFKDRKLCPDRQLTQQHCRDFKGEPKGR